MIQERQTKRESEPRSSRAHWLLELFGIGAFAALAALIGTEVYVGAAAFGYAWLLPAIAVVAYLAADLASGFVHFLADNFGSEETPILGPNFIGPSGTITWTRPASRATTSWTTTGTTPWRASRS